MLLPDRFFRVDQAKMEGNIHAALNLTSSKVNRIWPKSFIFREMKPSSVMACQ
jgi:hypothetical protein